jgi:hypothetical protein
MLLYMPVILWIVSICSCSGAVASVLTKEAFDETTVV